jgi:transcription-repair coupling factor (superfamily II helicase)
VDDLAAELADRFGPPPDEARRLLDFARLRCRAGNLHIAWIRISKAGHSRLKTRRRDGLAGAEGILL